MKRYAVALLCLMLLVFGGCSSQKSETSNGYSDTSEMKNDSDPLEVTDDPEMEVGENQELGRQ